MSDIYFYFFPEHWIHLLCLVQLGQSAQFGGRLDIYEWEWTGVKIQLYSNLEEGVLKDQKPKICFFLSQSTENQKLYNISKNQPPKSIRRRDMGFPPIFDRKKVLLLPYLPSKLG